MFGATLFVSLGLLSSRGSNVVANHGGIGILAGLCIAFIFEARLKAGGIFFLFGAFPGVAFGVVIGTIRSMTKLHVASPDASDEGCDGRPVENYERPT